MRAGSVDNREVSFSDSKGLYVMAEVTNSITNYRIIIVSQSR